MQKRGRGYWYFIILLEYCSVFLSPLTLMNILIIAIFVLGYAAIAFEHKIHLNKAASALITGVLCWMIYIVSSDSTELVNEQLLHHLGELSQILFFLLGAMTIVELIDSHDGFEFVTQRITTTNKKKLLLVIGVLSFFFSAVLDNLTTTIVMVSLVRKLVADKNDRLILVGLVVIAANAGGAWSPIGDVSTTMLWIGGQVTAANIIIKLILPSIVCFAIPLLILRFTFKGKVQKPIDDVEEDSATAGAKHRQIVFFTGVGVLLMVPVFKTLTHLPPFMGMLIGLGIMWIVTEIIHKETVEHERRFFSVAYALRKIDAPSILFFLGILLAVAALESIGELQIIATWMENNFRNINSIVLSLGLLSSIVDNVPLVAATQGMYDLSTYPPDHYLWEFLAYCTGTGGSVLIIGSAAGVAAMGLEKINFFWYIKRIGWIALLGYFAGAIVYILQHKLFGL